MQRRQLLKAAAVVAGWGLGARHSVAAGGPLTWVVGFAAGGGSDFIARNVSPALGRALNRSVVIENKPGAAGSIAAAGVARAPADGSIVLTADNGILINNPALFKKLAYDPTKDFVPLAMLGGFPYVLAVTNDVQANSVQELLKLLKAKPRELTYASPGTGSPHHLATELLLDVTGTSALHVPYRGLGPALTDLIGGQVSFALLDLATGLPHIKSGKMRGLAIARPQRAAQLPALPTFPESGVSGFEPMAWQVAVVHSSTPKAAVDELASAYTNALNDPAVRKALTDFGIDVGGAQLTAGAGGLRAFLDREAKFWQPFIKTHNISLD